MLKRVLSLISAFALLTLSTPVLASEAPKILANIVFEDCAENSQELPDGLQIGTGIDARVISETGGNKLFYSKAWGEAAKLSLKLSPNNQQKKYVYSAKIKVEGQRASECKFFNMTDGVNTTGFLNVDENGSIRLPDGKYVASMYYGRWMEYTLVVDWGAQVFDLYIDGQQKIRDWYLAEKTYSPAKEIQFSVGEPSDGFTELYMDDIRVYEGTELPKNVRFPDVVPSREVYEFEPTTSLEIETEIYKDIRFDSGLESVSSQSEGAELSHAVVNGNGAMKVYADSQTVSTRFSDIPLGDAQNENRYVLSVDVMVNKISGNSSYLGLFDGKDAAGAWRVGAKIGAGGKITMTQGGALIGTCDIGKWTEIAFAYNIGAATVDAYVNGELVAEGVATKAIVPTFFRIDYVNGSGGTLDCYVDNIRIYKAKTRVPRETFGEDTIIDSSETVSSDTSIVDTRAAAKSYIGDASVFMLTNSYMYLNRTKQQYPADAKPYIQGETLYIPFRLLEMVNGTTSTYDAASGKIQVGDNIVFQAGEAKIIVNGVEKSSPAPVIQDGTVYLPFESLMKQGFGKYVQYDDRGFVILSDTEFKYTNSSRLLEIYEPIDDIYRFMQYDNPDGKEMLAALKKNHPNNGHPRLRLTTEDANYILDKMETGDERWANAYRLTLADAESYMDFSVPKQLSDQEKQNCATRYSKAMAYLGLAYLLSGDQKYAETAVKMMEDACSWDNLGESYSQLTTGFWCMGTALGIDYFYGYMNATPEGRETFEFIKSSLKRMVFPVTRKAYQGTEYLKWVNIDDNFAGVIAGGMMSLLIAMGDEDGFENDVAYLMENVYRTMQLFVGLYYPDGAWYEGISYSDYGLEHTAYALTGMRNSFGTDYGLMDTKGFEEAGLMFVYGNTPEETFNFHDSANHWKINNLSGAEVAYLAGRTDIMEACKRERTLSKLSLKALDLMRYDKLITDKGEQVDLSSMPLDKYFRVTEYGTFYNSLSSDNPTMLAFHGGETNLPHDMLDLGQFFFIADKVVWACDLGRDDYSLPGYFAKTGYQYYRKNTQGENCIVINPLADKNYYGQALDISATLIDFESKPRAAKAAYDLTAAYKRDVSSYIRGYYFGDNRNSVTIRDELTLKENSELYWQMHTVAEINIIDKNNVILTKDGKQCKVEISCNVPYEVLDMDPVLLPGSPGLSQEGQNPNEGFRKLAIKTNAPKGNVKITVKLSPVTDQYIPTAIDASTNIADWTLPDGEVPKPLTVSTVYTDGKPMEGFYPEMKNYTITLPFGKETPPVIAATADDAVVRVEQNGNVSDTVRIVVSKEGYHDVVYTFDFVVSSDRTIKVTEEVVDIQPQLGLAGTLIQPVTASASAIPEVANGPSNMIDNDFSTRAAISGNCWFEIDLGEVKDFSGVAVSFMDGTKRQQIYDLLYSEDGVNYKRVFSGKALGTTDEYESVAIPGRARYIRLAGYGTTIGSWNSVTEFKVYQ